MGINYIVKHIWGRWLYKLERGKIRQSNYAESVNTYVKVMNNKLDHGLNELLGLAKICGEFTSH